VEDIDNLARLCLRGLLILLAFSFRHLAVQKWSGGDDVVEDLKWITRAE